VKAHWALLARHPWWSNLRQQGDEMGDGVVVLLPDRSHLELMEWVREAYRGESAVKLENLDTEKLEDISDFKEEPEDLEETLDETNFDNFTNDDYHEDGEEIKTERAVDEGIALQNIFQSEAISSAVATTLNNLIREGQYNVLSITKKCFEQIDNSKMVDRAFLEGFVIEDEPLLRIVRGRCRRKGETLFNCKECDFSTSLRNAMEKHVIDHLGKLPFKCDLCKENFGRRDNAVCDGCGMAFKSKSALKRHKSVMHDGIKPHACTICSFKAGQSHSLTVHYRGVHGLEKDVKERKTMGLQDT